MKMTKIKRWKIYNINLGHMYLYDILFWLSFYNFYRNGSHWSTDGCVVTQTGENFTNCRCNHLTNFAILVRPYQTVKSYFHIFFKLYSPFFLMPDTPPPHISSFKLSKKIKQKRELTNKTSSMSTR